MNTGTRKKFCKLLRFPLSLLFAYQPVANDHMPFSMSNPFDSRVHLSAPFVVYFADTIRFATGVPVYSVSKRLVNLRA
jgi:hypothetical protein